MCVGGTVCILEFEMWYRLDFNFALLTPSGVGLRGRTASGETTPFAENWTPSAFPYHPIDVFVLHFKSRFHLDTLKINYRLLCSACPISKKRKPLWDKSKCLNFLDFIVCLCVGALCVFLNSKCGIDFHFALLTPSGVGLRGRTPSEETIPFAENWTVLCLSLPSNRCLCFALQI